MSRINEVMQVLIPSGNQAVLPAGSQVSALAPNQIGVFDADTNLSIDGSAAVRDFFIAVGKATDGVNLDGLHTSAGQAIQTKNIENYTFRPHTAGRPQIVNVTDFEAICGSDYAMRIRFQNDQILKNQGSVPFTKVYTATSDCCGECDPCAKGQSVVVVKEFIARVNADNFKLVTATGVATEDLSIAQAGAAYLTGAILPAAAIDAVIAFNAAQTDEALKVGIGMQLTTNPLAIRKYCDINLQYYSPRQTTMDVSLVEGFDCKGTVTTIQEAVYEEGNAYDIKHKEYKAGGWNGRPGPYRASSVTGIAVDGFEYFAVDGLTYDQFTLVYDFKSIGTQDQEFSNLYTTIAISDKDTVTRNGLATVLDAISTPKGFDALSDEATGANTDEAVVEETNAGDDPDTDGLA